MSQKKISHFICSFGLMLDVSSPPLLHSFSSNATLLLQQRHRGGQATIHLRSLINITTLHPFILYTYVSIPPLIVCVSLSFPFLLSTPSDEYFVAAQRLATILCSVAVVLFTVAFFRPFEATHGSSRVLCLSGGICMALFDFFQMVAVLFAAKAIQESE